MLKRNTICEDLQLVSEHRWYEKWLFQKVNSTPVQNYFLQLQWILIFLQIHLRSRFNIQVHNTEQTNWHLSQLSLYFLWGFQYNKKQLCQTSSSLHITMYLWMTGWKCSMIPRARIFKSTYDNAIWSSKLGDKNLAAAILPFSTEVLQLKEKPWNATGKEIR